MTQAESLGKKPIPALLREQAIPASIGMLVMSIYGLIDAIFVGKWVGSLGIAAITVVMPITFLIASIGMAIGVGGASMISRALGSEDEEKAMVTFANQTTLTIILAFIIISLGAIYQDYFLILFGARGAILEPSKEYFEIILIGIPFLAWAMMTNNNIRAEGNPKVAMFTLVIPAILNIILDPIFIIYFEMGIRGAAWATTISYILSATYTTLFFLSGKSLLKIRWKDLWLRWSYVKEIFSIGIVTLARQGTVSILAIVLNNSLYNYGGELSVSAYGIVNKVLMFAIFPILGVVQGFLPIAGFNYGAKHPARVKEVIQVAIKYGTCIALLLFISIMLLSKHIVSAFTNDMELIEQSSRAMVIVFFATPLITTQLIGSAYFQAIGKALPALLLTMTKQGFFLIPLLFILPRFFQLDGIWMAFPIADLCAAIITYWYLRKAITKL